MFEFNTGMMSTKYSKMIHTPDQGIWISNAFKTYTCYILLWFLIQIQGKKFDNYKETNVTLFSHDSEQKQKQKPKTDCSICSFYVFTGVTQGAKTSQIYITVLRVFLRNLRHTRQIQRPISSNSQRRQTERHEVTEVRVLINLWK